MRQLALAVLMVLATVPAAAQRPQGPGGPQRPPPLPDHWLTLDSLAAAVGLSAEQRATVAEPYGALNTVMGEAARRRAQLRQEMQASLGGRSFQDLTDAERTTWRARGDSARAEFEDFQAEADMWHATIRNLLTAGQQTRFDALPKPILFRAGPRRGPPGS